MAVATALESRMYGLGKLARWPLVDGCRVPASARDMARYKRDRADAAERNLGLVRVIAGRFRGSRLSARDRIAEGTLGLMRALDRFDPAHGAAFSTYAAEWIRAKIYDAIVRDGLLSVARRGGIDARQEADSRVVPMAEEPHDRTLDARFHQDDAMELRDALRFLTRRERAVVRLRFGLGGNCAWGLEQVGRMIGVHRERVRQIESAAIAKLRRAFVRKRLLSRPKA